MFGNDYTFIVSRLLVLCDTVMTHHAPIFRQDLRHHSTVATRGHPGARSVEVALREGKLTVTRLLSLGAKSQWPEAVWTRGPRARTPGCAGEGLRERMNGCAGAEANLGEGGMQKRL